jgi:endonuclease YncB( thermonuclease family)
MRAGLAALLLVLAPAVHAAAPAEPRPGSFRATVTYVTDGDTLWVRPADGGERVEIRLLDLDAPEGCQAHGLEAKNALRERLLHQQVQVRTRGVDDYGRQLARIEHQGGDVGAWMVRQGHAWSMTFHGKRGPYARIEEKARRERRGLWSLPDVQDPRSFRKRVGRCGP